MNLRGSDIASFVFLCASLSLAACKSGPGAGASRSFGQLSCSSDSPSCVKSFRQGSAEISLHNVEAGAEYVIVLKNQTDFEQSANPPSRFEIFADEASGPWPSQEQEWAELIQRNTRFDISQIEHQETIGLPSNLYFPHIHHHNFDTELYLPDFNDYQSVDADGNSRKLWIRTSADPRLPGGDEKGFESLHVSPSQSFELLVDQSLSADRKSQVPQAVTCLEESFPKLTSLLGLPLDLDGVEPVQIAVAYPQSDASFVIGWFSELDRFLTFDGKPIPDSNYGEFLYVSPRLTRDPSEMCSNTAHEYLHLISFDHKVLRRLSANERSDMRSVQRRKLLSQKLNLDEATAQLVEELSGENQRVYAKVGEFLERPSGASFSLRSAGGSPLGNLQSRGLSQLLLYHTLHLYGGTLHWNDARTQQFLRDLVLSEGRGYEHLASLVNLSREELFESFYRHFALSLYSSEAASQFLPARVVENMTSRGIEIVDRQTPPQDWAQMDIQVFHPLGIALSPLLRAQSTRLHAEGISLWRWTAPEGLKSTTQVFRVESDSADFSFHIIRVR